MPKTPYTGKQVLDAFDHMTKRGNKDMSNSIAANLMLDLSKDESGKEFMLSLIENRYSGPDVFAGIELGLELAKLSSN